MADCLADLVLRPGENGLPPVQAQLTITAAAATLLGGDEPGEVDGEPLPAEVIREVAYALGLLPRPTTDTGADGKSDGDPPSRAADAAGSDRAAAAPGNTAPPVEERRTALATCCSPGGSQ